METETDFLETISVLVWNNISKQELIEMIKDRKDALNEQLNIPGVMLMCPFCGNEPTLKKQGWYPKSGNVRQQTYQVRCECGMTDKFWSRDTPEEAVAVWNVRH